MFAEGLSKIGAPPDTPWNPYLIISVCQATWLHKSKMEGESFDVICVPIYITDLLQYSVSEQEKRFLRCFWSNILQSVQDQPAPWSRCSVLG